MGLETTQYELNWNEQISEIVALRSILGTDFRLTGGLLHHKYDPAGDFQDLTGLEIPDPPISIFCQATIYVEIPEGEIPLSVVTSSSSSQPQTDNSSRLQYLPSVCLDIELKDGYPECEKPGFRLSCCWLSREQLSRVARELDQIWEDQAQSLICFSWYDWIHTSLLESLGFSGSAGILLDQSRPCVELDDRVECCMDETPIPTVFRNLVEYNRIQTRLCFEKKLWTCPVCWTEDLGKTFVYFSDCEHYFCKDCFQTYCRTNIQSGRVDLTCPGVKCKTSVHPSLLKNHLSKAEFDRWETLLLKRTLETMKDIQYCPRCSTACIEESNNFSQCPKCHFAFCTKCFTPWHPGSDCILLEDKLKELEELDIDKEQKARFIQELENQSKSLQTIETITRPCPWCGMAIEKAGGCNHMVCAYCNTHYCYACEQPIFDGYDHFGAGRCVLFGDDAIEEWEREILGEDDEEEDDEVRHRQNRREIERPVNPNANRMLICAVCKAINYKMDKNNHIRCHVCSMNLCFLCRQVLPKKNPTSHFHLGLCEQHTDL